MRRSLWLFSALSLSALLVVACSSDEDEALGPTATLATAPPTPAGPGEAPPDPSVIPEDPADIDEDYVQAVVDALFAVDAKATEIFVTTGELDEEGIEYLEAIYVPEELDRQVDIWRQTLEGGTQTLLPGALQQDVRRIIDVTRDCVYVEAESDFSETTVRQVEPQTVYLGLTPKIATDDQARINPTSWMLFMDGVNSDGLEPENPCADR